MQGSGLIKDPHWMEVAGWGYRVTKAMRLAISELCGVGGRTRENPERAGDVQVRIAWQRGYHGDDQDFIRDLHTVLSFGSEAGPVRKSGDKRSIKWVFSSEEEKRKATGYLLRYHWQDVTMTDLTEER